VSDSPPPLLRRGLSGWEPWNEVSREIHRSVPLGKIVKGEIRQPRNLLRHNFYWKGATVAAENMEEYETAKRLHIATKIHLGEFEPVPPLRRGGQIGVELGSTAFDKMPEHQFKEFLEAAFSLWAERLGCPVIDLMNEAREAA
jgi:hypothetical protein